MLLMAIFEGLTQLCLRSQLFIPDHLYACQNNRSGSEEGGLGLQPSQWVWIIVLK